MRATAGPKRLFVLAALAAVSCSTKSVPVPHASSPMPATRAGSVQSRPVSDAWVRRRVVLGSSVLHRPIVAEHIGDPDSPWRVLVVGCVHGDERGGISVVRRLSRIRPLPEVDLWLIPNLNPDGRARGVRDNADGVDLNRNFPYRWRPIGSVGSLHYAGPGPLSEPESRIAAALVRRVRPTLGIWYHQALDVVDVSEGPARVERQYAATSGLPVRALPDYPGSAVGYENHLFGPSAFVVELPAAVTDAVVTANARAVLQLARRGARVGRG